MFIKSCLLTSWRYFIIHQQKTIDMQTFMTDHVEGAFGECKKFEDPTKRVWYLRRELKGGKNECFTISDLVRPFHEEFSLQNL